MPDVILIPAGNPSRWTGPTGNNTWLLPGREPALVDAGVGHVAHLDEAARHLAGQPLARVFITHGHSDHRSGLPAIQARWPDVRVITVADAGLRVPAGDSHLLVIPTPGHAPDHACFHDEGGSDVFTGDLIRAKGSIVIPASKGGDLRAYLESLRLVRLLGPARCLPGHGPVIDDAARVIDLYLAHRAHRDAQILKAVGSGATTLEAIVARVYRGLVAELQAAARDSVLAHLVKLRDEGMVVERASGWALAAPARQ